jgi:hypothetical protein
MLPPERICDVHAPGCAPREYIAKRGPHQEAAGHWLQGSSHHPGTAGQRAVDLQRPDGKGHAVLQGVEELSGRLGGSAGVSLDHVPAGDHVAGGELLEDDAGQGTHMTVSTWTRSPGSDKAYCLSCARRRAGAEGRGTIPAHRCVAAPPGGRVV